MHDSLSLLRTNRMTRLLALLVAVCLLGAGVSSAAITSTFGERPACVLEELDACVQHDESSADKARHHELDKASGEADVPVPRSFRRWLSGSGAVDETRGAVGWLGCIAHDPPKTIRFCSLLI